MNKYTITALIMIQKLKECIINIYLNMTILLKKYKNHVSIITN